MSWESKDRLTTREPKLEAEYQTYERFQHNQSQNARSILVRPHPELAAVPIAIRSPKVATGQHQHMGHCRCIIKVLSPIARSGISVGPRRSAIREHNSRRFPCSAVGRRDDLNPRRSRCARKASAKRMRLPELDTQKMKYVPSPRLHIDGS